METTSTPLEIRKDRIVFVEGNDDAMFFRTFCKSMNLLDKIQVINCEGKDNLSKVVRTVVGFNRPKISVLGITRDGDDNPESAFQAIQTACRTAGCEVPSEECVICGTRPAVIAMVLPGRSSPGCLEDVCLAAFSDDPAMPCVDRYFLCLKDAGVPPHKQRSKARMQVFLASREEKLDLRLVDAVKKSWWPWDSTEFSRIRDFLLLMAR